VEGANYAGQYSSWLIFGTILALGILTGLILGGPAGLVVLAVGVISSVVVGLAAIMNALGKVLDAATDIGVLVTAVSLVVVLLVEEETERKSWLPLLPLIFVIGLVLLRFRGLLGF
jgi:hypothetical protein